MENQLYSHYGWDPHWPGPYFAETPGAIVWRYMPPPDLRPEQQESAAEAHGDSASLQAAEPACA